MKKLSFIALFIGLGMALSAQEFTVYGEGIIPTGRYGKSITAYAPGSNDYLVRCAITDTNNSLGGASYGWGAGIQFATPMAGKGVDLLFDAGFRLNWLNKEVHQFFDDYAQANNTVGITDVPLYYNIPLLFGPRFTFEMTEGFALFANVMVGVDIRIISDAIYSESLFYDYYTAYPLSFRLAGGFLINDHLRIEANWSWLGEDFVEASLYDGKYHDHGVLGSLETMHLGIRLGWSF